MLLPHRLKEDEAAAQWCPCRVHPILFSSLCPRELTSGREVGNSPSMTIVWPSFVRARQRAPCPCQQWQRPLFSFVIFPQPDKVLLFGLINVPFNALFLRDA